MSIARPALAAIAALGTSLALACLAAPWILTLAGIDPTETDLLNRLAGPSAAHPLGTDDLGRDLLARLLDGGRVSIVVGLTAAVIAATITSVSPFAVRLRTFSDVHSGTNCGYFSTSATRSNICPGAWRTVRVVT